MATTAEGAGPGPEVPARATAEVLRELVSERARLVEAVDRLKVEAQAARDRLQPKRAVAIAGGALVAMFVVRQALRRRRERLLVSRIAAAVRDSA
jgi:hypothetical protein